MLVRARRLLCVADIIDTGHLFLEDIIELGCSSVGGIYRVHSKAYVTLTEVVNQEYSQIMVED